MWWRRWPVVWHYMCHVMEAAMLMVGWPLICTLCDEAITSALSDFNYSNLYYDNNRQAQ